jgi:hypothetical protein
MHNTTGLRSCTVESRAYRFCGRPSIPDAPFPICAHHASTLFRYMADAIDHADDFTRLTVGLEDIDEHRAIKFRAERQPTPGVIYYLMVDGLVKIGYTANLDKRLADYPPSAQLLATEAGDAALEAARHREFGEYLTARREWFTPGPKLRLHIEGLADYRAA